MAEQIVYAAVFTGNRFRSVSLFLLTLFSAFVIGESAVYSQCAVLPPSSPTALTVSTVAVPTSTPISGGSGLVAQWKFDEGSGMIACDSSGNGNNGTLVNAPLWTAGKIGNALYFDGVNDNVVVAAASSLDLSGAFTLSAWVNPASTSTDFTSVLVKNYKYWLFASAAGYCGAGSPIAGFTEGIHNAVCQPSPLPSNTWTHLAVTYNGSILTLYRNGAAVATTAASATLSPTSGTLQIGASQDGSYFKGILDEVRIHSRALSATEIQGIYQQDSVGTSQNVATLIISPTGGNYSGPVSVTMQTATSGASIYYTANGSTPTQSSTLYTGPITLTSSAAIKANAFRNGYNPSAVASASFSISQTTGNVYYVAKTGSDSNSCTQARSVSTPKLTIAAGLACLAAGAGDALIIKAGTYAEAINYNQIPSGGGSWSTATKVLAASGETVTLRPTTGAYEGSAVIAGYNQSYIILGGGDDNAYGMIVDASLTSQMGVRIANAGANHIRIQNLETFGSPNTCTGNAETNSYIEFIHLKIHDCGPGTPTSGGPGHGIYIGGSSNNLVERNEIYNVYGHGIHLYHKGSNNNVIRYNYVHDNGSRGILIGSGNNNEAHDNIVAKNGAARGAEAMTIGYGGGSNNRAYNNTIYANAYQCLVIMADQTNATATTNNCWKNGSDAVIDQGVGSMVRDNSVADPFVGPAALPISYK